MIAESTCDTLAGENWVCVQILKNSYIPKALAFKILSWTDSFVCNMETMSQEREIAINYAALTVSGCYCCLLILSFCLLSLKDKTSH